MGCQDRGAYQVHLEKQAETVPVVIQEMLDLEVTLAYPDLRGTEEDLVSVILDPEDHRVTGVRRVAQAPGGAGETVDRREDQGLKEPQESRVSQDLRENLAREEREERVEQTETLVLREIPASQSVM